MNEDLEFMRNCTPWPLWPHLPVKNKLMRDDRGWPKMGLMKVESLDQDAPKPIVYEVNYTAMAMMKPEERNEAWKAAPKHEYTDLEGVVDAGWVVD